MLHKSSHNSSNGRPFQPREVVGMIAVATIIPLVLATAIGNASLRFGRSFFEHSATAGYLLCGDGLHLAQKPGTGSSYRPGIRIACLTADGTEVNGPNNGVALKLMAPIFLLLALPCWWMVWLIVKSLAVRKF